MGMIADIERSEHQYSTAVLWLGAIFALLFLVLLIELVCLGILYVSNSLKGVDNSQFAQEHLLTGLFVPLPPAPVPGKHFVGYLRTPEAWNQFLVADDLLGWRLASSTSAILLHYPYECLYVTDENGFIADVDDPPVELQKSVDTFRVIVLGGSTVMGAGAPRPSQNIVGMLRKVARERGLVGPNGRRIEFINAGVAGYNSAQEYLYLASDLLRFEPDLVVVYDGWNDSQYDSSSRSSSFRTIPDSARRLAQSYSTAESGWLFAENLGHFLARGVSKLAMFELPWRILRKLSPPAPDLKSSSVAFDQRNIDFYLRNRRAFLALADDQLSVALFLQPLIGTDDRTLSAEEKASWWYPSLDYRMRNRIPFYEHMRNLLADLNKRYPREGHQCIADLSRSLSGVSEPVYADSGHLLPRGNEIVAAHLLDELVLCGLL
jgi:hypothetical protein